MRRRWILLVACFVAFSASTGMARAQSTRMILALGNTGFLNPSDIRAATGAEVKQEMEKFDLKDFAVVILGNIPFASLPTPLQQGLVPYVNGGGTLLITGGAQSFGSGGYQAVASILPFQIRSNSDWRGIPVRLPVTIQPSHPMLAGIRFIAVSAVNDLNPRPGASELLQTAGGGSAAGRITGAGGGSYPYPLIAEVAVGAGRVIGIAFDLNEFAGMQDRDLFVRNTISYLLSASRM